MFIRFSVPVPPKIEIYRTHLIERGWDIGRYNLCHWKCYSHHDQQFTVECGEQSGQCIAAVIQTNLGCYTSIPMKIICR